MAKQHERQKVADEVLVEVRRRILTGRYAPGTKLPPERDLARELGVNRASLREALKKLEHLGLVRIRQGDGTRVTHFEQTAGIELVSHLLPLSPELAADVLEFRRLVGRELARLAAERATAADVDRLRALAADGRAPELSPERRFDLDFAFYAQLAACTGNRVLSMLINTVRAATESMRPALAVLTVSPERMAAHHDAVIAAIEARDADAAARAAEAYLRDGERKVLGDEAAP
ncbi:MAG: FadR family transcriptional regulator [Deltaproteobacteria bacterium]|nr:MAG: FadR family transcriptional regulator [Deltaproteobacteria bacterium]